MLDKDKDLAERGLVTGSGAASRAETIAVLAARLGLDSLLVSIPRTARALGYAPSTLYGYIAKGAFFLPCRMVNGSPMVVLDDLIDWLASRSGDAMPTAGAVASRVGPRRLAEEFGSPAWRAEVERRAFAKSVAARVEAMRGPAGAGGPKRRGRPPKSKGPNECSAPSSSGGA